MSYTPLERAKLELIYGEQLIWADHPDGNRQARRKNKAALFGKVMVCFVILWVIGVLYSSFSTGNLSGLALAFFALPFIFFARKLVSKPEEARKKAEQTCYALTNQRLLIIDDYKSKSIESFDLNSLEFIERREHDDGTGDILFAKSMVTTAAATKREDNHPPREVTREIKKGFIAIHEAQKVEQEILRLKGNN